VAVVGLLASSGEMPLTTSSEEARGYFVKARDMADNIEFGSAIRLCNQALEKDPSFAMAYVLLGSATGGSAFRENVAKAAALIDKVSPGEKEWILAEQAIASGEPAEAGKHLEQLVQMFPNDKHVQVRVGVYAMNQNRDRGAAMAHLSKAVAIDPAFAAAYNLMGYFQADGGDYQAAERSFKRYIALQPTRPNPYDSYGELLMKMGRYDASIAQYRKALEKDPAFVSAYAGIGANLMFEKNYDGARQQFDQQRAKSPDLDAQLDALENTAKSYVAEKKIPSALDTYQTIAERAKSEGIAARVATATRTAPSC
jgi:tetratricopeptide (TPR) repeat protein